MLTSNPVHAIISSDANISIQLQQPHVLLAAMCAQLVDVWRYAARRSFIGSRLGVTCGSWSWSLPQLFCARHGKTRGRSSRRRTYPGSATSARRRVLWGLTFELSGSRRRDARPTLWKMRRTTGRAWWPAVGAPLERGVRQHCVLMAQKGKLKPSMPGLSRRSEPHVAAPGLDV